MEEIDKIIIDSLKHLNYELEEEIQSLKQFDADMVVKSVSLCLEAICKDPELKLPKKLPPSMSQRLNVASNLAQQIKDLGFRGDMGYQTILYCNEVEIRRLLMFLIERLPKETSKVVQIEQAGYVPKIVKRIEENIRNSMRQMWLPSCVLDRGSRELKEGYMISSFGNSATLRTEILKIPNFKCSDDGLKQYYIYKAPIITKQQNLQILLPSLLFMEDSDFEIDASTLKKLKDKQDVVFDLKQVNEEIEDSRSNLENRQSTELQRAIIVQNTFKEQVNENASENALPKLQILMTELSTSKKQYLDLQQIVSKYEAELVDLKNAKNDVHENLKSKTSKIKLKTKALAILNHQENKQKLKNLIENGTDRLVELANQWSKVQTPLLEEYKTLQNSLSAEELKIHEEQSKLSNLTELKLNLEQQLAEKVDLEQNLVEKCQQISKNNSRVAYTRRIMEIVGNIKKQNVEIDKILQDSKNIQKDINSLTGQVDRSFTLSDELIFYDAKYDDTARKAYKLLANLRDEFNAILKGVDELGQIERDSRNLQEQVDSEKSKEIGIKLDRVHNDIEQIKKEIENLK